MHYGLLSTQLAVIDSFLAELALGRAVDFNNTRQFDALLTHLEASLCGPLVLVPSEDVLHILFTLAARVHHSAADATDMGSHYMRQVDMDYDAAVAKSLLQQRAQAVLQRYVEILAGAGEDAGGEVGAGERALRDLYARMEAVVRALVPARRNFFARAAEPSPPAPVVEVISDSEGLDSLLEMEHPHAAARKIQQYAAPALSAAAVAGLGTSGLGEASALFRQMPHLLAHATPEPEPRKRRRAETLRAELPEPSPARAKPLRPKNGATARLRVFGDVVLAHALDPDRGYDVWALLRWCFACARTSTQYQGFLFDASRTRVHAVYRAYEGVLSVVFAFMAEQHRRVAPAQSLCARALRLLGAPRDACERAVACAFAGLDQASHASTYPCYARERPLLKHDPAVQVSRCKSAARYVDNQHLMRLRAQLVALLLRHQDAGQFAPGALEAALAARLLELRFRHVRAFVRAARPARLVRAVCSRVLSSITGVRLELEGAARDEHLARVLAVVSDERLYAGVAEDFSLGSFDAFWQRWQTALFLAQWLLVDAAGAAGAQDDAAMQRHCVRGDRLRERFYRDFLCSRADDADVQPEDLPFTLTAAERARYAQYTTPAFCDVARCMGACPAD